VRGSHPAWENLRVLGGGEPPPCRRCPGSRVPAVVMERGGRNLLGGGADPLLEGHCTKGGSRLWGVHTLPGYGDTPGGVPRQKGFPVAKRG